MDVKVTVILPSLNVVDYIEECLDSVISQSLQELEIICVDAGSTDGTRELLDGYAQRDSRITVLHSDIKSYGRQVNMGLEHAKGEYVAVLETDDWIDPDMYRCLYENGVADRLDYVAADFDLFSSLQNGNRYYARHYLFSGDKRDWYDRILDSDEITMLRASDYVLWRGIYEREFLNAHHIRLHESPGAAFQDMGFLQQVKTYAKKAKYIDRSLYRYRQDRGGASSGKLEGLRYYEKEFSWINDVLKFDSILKGVHRKYYYYTMSISFITKYEQILIKLNGDWQDDRLRDPYKWFRRQITDALNSRTLDEGIYEAENGRDYWERMMLLLTAQNTHAQLILEKEKKREECAQEFLDRIKNRRIVIFGCGIRGERLMLFCESRHKNIGSFCDNNAAFQGKKKFGIPIISPSGLKSETFDKHAVVVLSMKNGTDEVHGQLVEMGIEPDRIIDKIPEEIL